MTNFTRCGWWVAAAVAVLGLTGCGGDPEPQSGTGGGTGSWVGGGTGSWPYPGGGTGTGAGGGAGGGGTGTGGAGGGGEAQVGRVTGTVRDTQGRPIPGARVRIENDFLYFDVTTDSNGRYVSPSLPIGGYKAVAWADVTYEGMTYLLRLGMPEARDYDFFGSEGAVRDFQWQLTGRIPDRTPAGATGYFGGALEFVNGTGSLYDARMDAGDVVVVRLEPVGPLIDGSEGQVLERSFTVPPHNEFAYVVDIPVGVYRVTARRFVPGGASEDVLVGSLSQQGAWATVWFLPSGDYSYESGFKRTSLYLRLNR